jgi:hypothetical protein
LFRSQYSTSRRAGRNVNDEGKVSNFN